MSMETFRLDMPCVPLHHLVHMVQAKTDAGVPAPAALSLRSRIAVLFRHEARVHAADAPAVPVEVVKAPVVHEAVIPSFTGGLAAIVDSDLHELVDLGPALARQREERFGVRARVAN